MPVPFIQPMSLCLVVVAVIAAFAAGQVNRAIYSLSYFNPRPLSPWSRVAADAPQRTWLDCIPIYGWMRLRREKTLHEPAFWVRPLLIELVATIGIPVLYYAELSRWLLPPLAKLPAGISWENLLHGQFVSHVILIFLMAVATFIDFDEKMIPDEITIPGTLIGLILAVAWPFSFTLDGPPLNPVGPPMPTQLQTLLFANPWPDWLDGPRGLALGVGIYVLWCFALVPYLCTLRRGWVKGFQFAVASFFRSPAWKGLTILAVVGSVVIAVLWMSVDAERWRVLLSALVGVAGGGGLIWTVRIIGQVALGKEAMGFGDVTLMSMIGAFVGWQACGLIFFMAPLAAIAFALGQTLLSGRRDIPYGPYLCIATLACILFWKNVWWGFAKPIFDLAWLLIALLAVLMVLMMGMLMLWRLIESALFAEPSK
jgi:leader peptidase (prepilin peptidase)/N-methyltransferase